MRWLSVGSGLKLGALFCAFVVVSVTFSSLQGGTTPTSAPPLGDAPDASLENGRRLTLAAGSSLVPELAAGTEAIHLGWLDGRSGSLHVFHKATADGGRTFSSDRSLAAPASPGNLSIGADNRAVALAWDALATIDGQPTRSTFYMFSPDGQRWTPQILVGAGWAPDVQVVGDRAILTFLWHSPNGTAIRSVMVEHMGTTVGNATALTAFSARAADVETVVRSGRLHVVWDERVEEATALVHVSVNLGSGATGSPSSITIFQGSLDPASLSLAAGPHLQLAWSDNRFGHYQVRTAFSADAGASWTSSGPLTPGDSDARQPSVALNATGRVRVAWQDSRTGVWQVFSRGLAPNGDPNLRAQRITHTRSAAEAPSLVVRKDVAFVAWQDARDGEPEIYGDTDAGLTKPSIRSVGTYLRRLPLDAFAPPQVQSKAALLGRVDMAAKQIAAGENRGAVQTLGDLRQRMDGTAGGDPRDDLLVDREAQDHLLPLVDLLIRDLIPRNAPGQIGTRAGNIPPEDDPPQIPGPIPGDDVVAIDHEVTEITSTSARVTWRFETIAGFTPVLSSWVDYWLWEQPPLRKWDNTTPYSVVLTSLVTGSEYFYKIGGVLRSGRTAWSENATFATTVQIRDLRVEGVTYTSATIKWDSNLVATGKVYYGTTNNYGQTATGPTGSTHSIPLTGLTPKTKYYFFVESVAVDDSTMKAQSGERTFHTGITILGVSVGWFSTVTDFGFTVTWNTNIAGTSVLDWGQTESYGQTATGADGTSHYVTLTNPPTGTTIYFRAKSVSLTDSTDSVNTTGGPLSVPHIAIRNWQVATVTETTATLTWDTYVGDSSWSVPRPATSVVKYGITETEQYTHTATGADGTSHTVSLTNLQSGTTYHFRIESASLSNSNDVAKVSNRTFTTKGIGLAGAFNVVPQARYAWFYWNTTISGTTEVWVCRSGYPLDCYTRTAGSGTGHSLNATGLLPLTTYQFTATSASLTNPNDRINAGIGSLTTKYAPNDADRDVDAAPTFAGALQIAPGRWKGQLEQGVDLDDYMKVWVRPGQLVRASLWPPATYNFDLRLYDPSGGLVASSALPGSAMETVSALAGVEGSWAVRATYVSGTYYGIWDLELNLTGGDVDQLFLDVGKSGDGDAYSHLPGMSLDLAAGWGSSTLSPYASTATWDQLDGNPDYRQASTNATFLLNLYNYTSQRYTDYLITVQYYASADVNVSVNNGGGWAVLSTMPGKGNWWAHSFRISSTQLSDARSAIPGMNVALRFSATVQVDRISAVAFGYRTYVGSGSDDTDDRFHVPGVLLGTGWMDEGMPYKNATTGAEFFLTVPDPDTAYLLSFTFNGTGNPVWVEQWTGIAWTKIGRLGNYTSGAALSTGTKAYADASALPGVNVKLRVAAPANEVSSIAVAWSAFEDNVGTPLSGQSDDGDLGVQDPGITILVHPLNQEWGAPTSDFASGRTVRSGAAFADIYINSPILSANYTLAVTYQASQAGSIQQWDGSGWQTIGPLEGDSTWRTAQVTANRAWFADWYGNANVNARFQFTVAVLLDALSAYPDQDLDRLSDFQETYGYAYVDETAFSLTYSKVLAFNVSGPGRYTFEIDSSSLDGKMIIEVDSVRKLELVGPWVGTAYVNGSMCGRTHYLGLWYTGGGSITVTAIRYARDTTDLLSNDSDADGWGDWFETCELEEHRFGSSSFTSPVTFNLYPTDPLNRDTDFDGLTDHEELYSFAYADAVTRTVTPSSNYTLNLTVGESGTYEFSLGTTGYPASGKAATALIYVNGMPSWKYASFVQWTQAASFSARLVKGHNSLRVSIQEAVGSLSVTSVSVAKTGWLTSPTEADTDEDGIEDGDEQNGATGWVLHPLNPDTDGDQVPDGEEVGPKRTDPTNPDTDGDGVNDYLDWDPLHDLVLQLRLSQMWITYPNPPQGIKYYALGGIEGTWTITKNDGPTTYIYLDHYISVNVPDWDRTWSYNFTVRDNIGNVIDVTPSTSTTQFSALFDVADQATGYLETEGTQAIRAKMGYSAQLMKVGKVNTLLIVPMDYSTIFNGSTGLHRYVGEQKFVFVLLNVSGQNSYFDNGMNAIIVPRGIYFDTKFHKLLNDTWAGVQNSALVGATVIGNDDTNSRALNAKVVQMIVSHNVTAVKAKELLDLLLINVSLGRIGRSMDVTDEFYTMGFVQRVVELTPYVAVFNTGNFTPPTAPPPHDNSFWGAFWNTIAGAAQFLWNAVRAVAVFISQVAAAVVQWAMSVAKAFVEAVYSAVKAIAEAIVAALLAVIKFIVDMVMTTLRAFVDNVFNPAIEGMKKATYEVFAALLQALETGRDIGASVLATSARAMPWIAIFVSAILLIMVGVGWAINGIPPLGLLVAGLVIVILIGAFMALFPQEPAKSDPWNVGTFLSGIQTKYGSALFIFGAITLGLGWLTKLLPPVGPAVEWEILIAMLFGGVTFLVGAIAKGVDGQDGAVAIGLLAMAFADIGLILSSKAAVGAVLKALTPGHKIAYGILMTGFAIASLMGFLSASGYFYRNVYGT